MQPIDPALLPFTADDAIFDPDVDAHLVAYLDRGGDGKLASDHLSNSYSGYEDTITEIYNWGQLVGIGDIAINNALKEVITQHQSALIPQIDKALSNNPESASLITTLAASPIWSAFMVDLAARHKQTSFYDVITREAKLSDIGLSSDILSTPEAFLDAMTAQFEKLFSLDDPVSKHHVTDFLRKMAIMCTYDELTTVVSLRLLAELAHDTEDSHELVLYRRLSQEIQAEAVNVMTKSSVVPKTIARQYIMRLVINIHCAMSSVDIKKPVIDALVTIADSGHRRRFDREVSVLLKEYGSLLGTIDIGDSDASALRENSSDPTPVEKRVLLQTLCHFEIVADLTKALYSHSCRTYVEGRPYQRKRRCLSMLLAYVSVFLKLNDRQLEEGLNSETTKQMLLTTVKQTYDALNSTAAICEDLLPGSSRSKIKGKPIETLLNGITDPIIARGIVLWAKECLHGGTDLRALLKTAPKHLGFLEAVVKLHDNLCEDVLLVIHTAFTRNYPGLNSSQVNQLRELFVKTIIGMVNFTVGPQVVLVFKRLWVDSGVAKKPDLRNFVTALFRTISPPYSEPVAVAVNEFLRHDKVLSAIEGDVTLSGRVFNFQDETAEALNKQNGITVS